MAPDQVKYLNKLTGKSVLIIGGTSGIGFGVAEALLEYGAGRIVLSSSNPQRVEQSVQKLKDAYPSASTKCDIAGSACDLGTEDALESNIKTLLDFATVNGTRKLDHIVYTAGDGLATMKLDTINMDKVKKAGMVRFFGPLFVAKYIPQYMNGGPESSFSITTGSVSERPIPDWSVVGSYATGLQGMTRSLALDLQPRRVNLISPGGVETPLWGTLVEDKLKEGFRKGSTTKRFGQPEDVALSYIYLMTDYNITGTMISSNSGALLLGPNYVV